MSVHKEPVQMRDCIVIVSLKQRSTDIDDKPDAFSPLKNLNASECAVLP